MAISRCGGAPKSFDYIDHLRENMGALNVHLTPADLSEIEMGFSRIEDLWRPHGCQAAGAERLSKETDNANTR